MAKGEFKDFVNQKLLKEESKQVSVQLTKNIIDIIRDYVVTEYDISEDEKSQILSNMKIGLEEHDKGVLKKGPKFVATSKYNETEDKEVPVEIVIEIVTEKIGQKQTEEPAEGPVDIDIDTEETEDDEEEPAEEPEE